MRARRSPDPDCFAGEHPRTVQRRLVEAALISLAPNLSFRSDEDYKKRPSPVDWQEDTSPLPLHSVIPPRREILGRLQQ
jgi:hypothetical protein